MQPVTRTAIVLIFAALFAIISSWYAWINITTKLKTELKTIELRFDNLVKEHQRFAALADETLKARSIINEHYLSRYKNLYDALECNKDYSDCGVPESVRLQLGKGYGASEPGAANGASGADDPPGPQPDSNQR